MGEWVEDVERERERKKKGRRRGKRIEGKPPPQPPAARASMPANLYWFLPSNTQSDIFLLRQSTRLTPPLPSNRAHCLALSVAKVGGGRS